MLVFPTIVFAKYCMMAFLTDRFCFLWLCRYTFINTVQAREKMVACNSGTNLSLPYCLIVHGLKNHSVGNV